MKGVIELEKISVEKTCSKCGKVAESLHTGHDGKIVWSDLCELCLYNVISTQYRLSYI